VTTLLRDTQANEFAAVFRFPVDADRRSDIFTSQTVTTLLWSTSGGIESPLIKSTVVEILEGTEPAFKNRKRKYGL
jgi:hypothetical protein